jgi:hypothetical protein
MVVEQNTIMTTKALRRDRLVSKITFLSLEEFPWKDGTFPTFYMADLLLGEKKECDLSNSSISQVF